MKKMLAVLAVTAAALLGNNSPASALVDVVESPTGYFTPTDSQKYDSPYYRWNGDDWGWAHSAVSGTFSTATLSVSAFDVDYDSWSTYYTGERDAIYAYDNGVKTFLGYLAGGNDIWSYTTFTLGSNFFDDIATGLQVWMGIDTTNEGWAVSLAKSVLSLDGGSLPNPNPNPVPEPSTLLLLGGGLAGLALARRRFAKK